MTAFFSIGKVLAMVCLLGIVVGPAPQLFGQEFRIESSVYNSTSNLPVSQNVTLFSQGLIYDFQLSDDAQPTALEIAIYDTRKQMMILLDPERKVRFELPDLRLMKIVEAVRRDTLQDNRTSFLVEDDFTEDIDLSTNWVTLTSPEIEYRFHGKQPKDVSLIPSYLKFLDRFTQLNASDPTKLPPFARMKLNQSIQRLGWVPSEVQISVKQNGLFRQPFSAKSKHVLINKLSDQDRQRITKAKQNWMQFESVDLEEYRGLEKNPMFEFPSVKPVSHEEELENATRDLTRNSSADSTAAADNK